MKLAHNVCLGQIQNWVTWGQKLGHQAKSKENLVHGHTFEAIITNLT